MDIDGTWKRYTLRSMQVIHTFDMYFYGWMDKLIFLVTVILRNFIKELVEHPSNFHMCLRYCTSQCCEC
ncbi:hypothetical protein EYC84_009264 [Monilinia fructicola]|uniref:Uncharacterized protein n=1 Tax=Monilinia fructicola TaxID=38448 RepID=A0A5M9JBL3_MONFR|nr:hypothetical protein EYC84_009264 [Monilinia fructicola]